MGNRIKVILLKILITIVSLVIAFFAIRHGSSAAFEVGTLAIVVGVCQWWTWGKDNEKG